MPRRRLAPALALTAALCGLANAECSIDPKHYNLKFSDQAMAARNAFFLSKCNAIDGDLIDITDPTVIRRLEFAGNAHSLRRDVQDFYPASSRRAHHEGQGEYAFIIEKDGAIRSGAVIVSSGYKDLDQAAIYRMTGMRYRSPFKLDGVPVRVILYMPFSWKLN